MRRTLPHFLALFVAAHIGTSCISGMGSAPPWAVEAAPDASDHWNRGRLATKRLVRPYVRFAGTKQHWAMFGGTHKTVTRLEVAIEVDGEWRNIFVEGSTEGDWRRATLDHYRFRQYRRKLKRPRKDRRWREFVGWVSTAALADHSEADRVRVRAVRARIPPPEARGPAALRQFRQVRKTSVVER